MPGTFTGVTEMKSAEAIADYRSKRAAWQAATKAEREARAASRAAEKAVQVALIEEHGFKIDQELPGAHGPQWIKYIGFDPYSQELYASCIYTLKSGKKSKQYSRVPLLSIKE